EAVLRIVPLAAVRALQIPSPSGALAVVIFGNNEAGAATARDEEHSDRSCRDLFRLATGHQFNLLLLWPWRSFSSYLPVRLSSSGAATRSEEHTSELQSRSDLVCRLLLEK